MLFQLLGFCTLIVACTAKVQMKVYYESLCPDSNRFIVKQLHPVKSSPLGDYIDVQLIPFGKASFQTYGGDVNFTCQHGPNECYGNKVHACAIKHIQVNSFQSKNTRESLTLDYVKCLMERANEFKDTVFPGERCARELELSNWNVIHECANTTEGSKLLQGYGEMTMLLKPELKEVPTITFDGEMASHELNVLAIEDLRTTACQYMREPKPHECQKPSSANFNSFGFSILILSAAFWATFKLLF